VIQLRSRLRATGTAVVWLEVRRDKAIAATHRHGSHRTGEVHKAARLPGENVLDLKTDKSIIAPLWYLRTLDTGASRQQSLGKSGGFGVVGPRYPSCPDTNY